MIDWCFGCNKKREDKMRVYTKAEINLIRRQYINFKKGQCICLRLIEAKASGKISEDEYQKIKTLEIKCPLHTSGVCRICQAGIDAGKIDMFQAVRDLRLLSRPVKQIQLSLFSENWIQHS